MSTETNIPQSTALVAEALGRLRDDDRGSVPDAIDLLRRALDLNEEFEPRCGLRLDDREHQLAEPGPEQEGYDLATFFETYLEAALWSSADENGDMLDNNYSLQDIPEDVRERMRAECERFIAGNRADLTWLDAAQAGPDFWLARNHHGAGFWDRGLGEIGERLTSISESFGEIDLYVGDDGKIYASGMERDASPAGWDRAEPGPEQEEEESYQTTCQRCGDLKADCTC